MTDYMENELNILEKSDILPEKEFKELFYALCVIDDVYSRIDSDPLRAINMYNRLTRNYPLTDLNGTQDEWEKDRETKQYEIYKNKRCKDARMLIDKETGEVKYDQAQLFFTEPNNDALFESPDSYRPINNFPYFPNKILCALQYEIKEKGIEDQIKDGNYSSIMWW